MEKASWAKQQVSSNQKGAWLWLRFKNEPWEADDSDYFGATLAAVAVGIAPGNYRATPEVQAHLKLLREYLDREFDTSEDHALLHFLREQATAPSHFDTHIDIFVVGQFGPTTKTKLRSGSASLRI